MIDNAGRRIVASAAGVQRTLEREKVKFPRNYFYITWAQDLRVRELRNLGFKVKSLEKLPFSRGLQL